MGLGELNWWILEAKGFALKVWQVWHGSKPSNEFGTRTWDDFMNFKKDIVEGTQTTIEGVNFIVDQVFSTFKKKYGGWKRKALAVGLSLIAANDCRKKTIEESRKVMQKTSEALLWMTATEFNFKLDVPRGNIEEAFRNVELFLDSCIDSCDPVYKDAAKIIRSTMHTIQQLCTDKGFQKRHFTRCGCRCNCTQKTERMLIDVGLVNLGDVNGTRTAHPKSTIQQVCSATQKLSSCERSCTDDVEEGDALARKLDSFCKRHSSWDPNKLVDMVPANAPAPAAVEVPTNAPKEAAAKAGTATLETAFYYILLNVYMVI